MNLSSPQAPAGDHEEGAHRHPKEPLGPDSLAWRLGFPRTGLLLAGRALLLQVMHPVIGAGVRDFSDFKTDPWGRLDRTLTSLQLQLFGGADAVDEAERLRTLHASIRGTGFDGAPYSALNQDAYAWVHLSNFDTLLTFDRVIARQMHPAQREQLFAEWRQAGRVLGIRDEHMPSDLSGLTTYVHDMITGTLTDNPTARDVLKTLRMRQVGPPPWRLFPEPLWRALRPLGRTVLHDTTVGTLPVAAREKLGLTWTESDQRRLRALALAVRAASVPVPDSVMQYPLARRAQIEAKRFRAQAQAQAQASQRAS